MSRPSRRSLILIAAAAAMPAAAAPRQPGGGQLRARPQSDPAAVAPPKGVTRLGVRPRRDALVYTPAGLRGPLPLLVLLHGAGGSGANMITPFRSRADALGFAILAPQSTGMTWPVGAPLGGPEVTALDAVLDAAFDRLSIDEDRIAVGGFSDGASYALSLGLANGALFSDILAFSPGGFEAGEVGTGPKPRVFVGHGRTDRVLPFSNARAITMLMRRADYDVQFFEFDGGHQMTGPEIDAGLSRFLGAGAVRT